jgi:5-methylcytosine-specific restriction endonuclease McrA
MADFLVALAAFDRERTYRALGYANVFDYLHRELRLSRAAAHYRKVAARLVGKFPEVVEPLRDGRLCITSVLALAKVMTDANRAEVLPRFFHCSKQEAREVAAEIAPVTAAPRKTGVTEVALPSSASAGQVRPGELAATTAVEDRRTTVDPLTPALRRLHLTVSTVLLEKLKRARAGQSHVQPGASDEQVIDAALDLLLAQQAKRRAGVPPRVKREVLKRDEGRCTWPLASGGVCGSTVRLEVDHVVPRGQGGPSTPDNCRILCKAPELSPRIVKECGGRSIG